MEFSQADIDNLKQAIAKGVQTVSYGDRSVTYRSLDEMIRLLNILTAGKEQPKRVYYPSFSNGKWPR